MGNTAAQSIADLPERLQPAVALWFERLADRDVALPADLVAPVSRLVACSEFAGKVLLREFPWFIENFASFSSVADDLIEAFAALAPADDETRGGLAHRIQLRHAISVR